MKGIDGGDSVIAKAKGANMLPSATDVYHDSPIRQSVGKWDEAM